MEKIFVIGFLTKLKKGHLQNLQEFLTLILTKQN